MKKITKADLIEAISKAECPISWSSWGDGSNCGCPLTQIAIRLGMPSGNPGKAMYWLKENEYELDFASLDIIGFWRRFDYLAYRLFKAGDPGIKMGVGLNPDTLSKELALKLIEEMDV